MVRHEQQDYFFVVEDDRQAIVHARGEGQEVLAALSRTSLALMGNEDDTKGLKVFGRYERHGVYMATQLALAAYESAPNDYVRYSVNTLELSDILHYSPGVVYDERLEGHNNTLIQRVKDGMRSPASVTEELMQQARDKQLLKSVSRRWFNKEGWALSIPMYRKMHESPTGDARELYRVTRNNYLDPEVRENLFDVMPKRSKAYHGRRAPLNRYKRYDLVNERRPFLLGAGLVEDVYGYIASGGKEFVPVVTQRRPWRPGE